MFKQDLSHSNPFIPSTRKRKTGLARAGGTVLLVGLGVGSLHWLSPCLSRLPHSSSSDSDVCGWLNCKPSPGSDLDSPYGRYPLVQDPFKFIPCTNTSLPPPLDDPNAAQTWAAQFDPDPEHWNWGQPAENETAGNQLPVRRGIYLCGYLDLPLDYLNASDNRIVRLAVNKFQVSGLARLDDSDKSSRAGHKSDHTIILEPGGPGGSGTAEVWQTAELVSKRFSDGKFDVLGWDPRGVNISLPTMACFPDDALRDRWLLFTDRNREVSNPLSQLQIADVMNDAKFHSCRERLGDFGRFVGTSSVARDLEQIREALQEEKVTGYFVSYGTAIAQTFASIFPDRVGRMILDGSVDAREYRHLGGFAMSYFDEKIDVWRDGFLTECINAGPEWCALAKSKEIGTAPISQNQLEARVATLLDLLKSHPIPAYTPYSGPSIVTYSALVSSLFPMMYNPSDWPATAQMLYELEMGNSTLAAIHLEGRWRYKPLSPTTRRPASAELPFSVICADSYNAPLPPDRDSERWWDRLWESFTQRSWLSGNFLFSTVFPCSNYRKHWAEPPELYSGDLNYTLENPFLLISVTHDPATPLRHGKKLLTDMGSNARLIVHHGYGHTSSADRSDCTDHIAKDYLLHGIIPSESELECYANKRPFVNFEYSEEYSSININRWPF